MTLKIPVPGGYKGQSVKIYFSHDGTNWMTHESATTSLTMIGAMTYAIVPSTHATMFAIGTSS